MNRNYLFSIYKNSGYFYKLGVEKDSRKLASLIRVLNAAPHPGVGEALGETWEGRMGLTGQAAHGNPVNQPAGSKICKL